MTYWLDGNLNPRQRDALMAAAHARAERVEEEEEGADDEYLGEYLGSSDEQSVAGSFPF